MRQILEDIAISNCGVAPNYTLFLAGTSVIKNISEHLHAYLDEEVDCDRVMLNS